MWNDKETNNDLLGYNKIAETIVSIMNEQDLRPLTVGVYGNWGVGKSSVLSLIQSQLQTDKETLCLTFNGWLFQGYEDTRSALMETVVGELMRLQPNDKKILRLGKTLLKRIKWLKVAKISGAIGLTALTGLPAGALLGLPGLLSGAKEFLASKGEEKEGDVNLKVEQESDESLLKEAEETVPGQIHAFRDELKELIKSSKIYRVVVLVDELDRCLPTAVIDILEAIRLFLFVEGTVFVLAADEQMIEYAVRRHYPDLPVAQADYTKHYLEKMVQIPIRIPSLNQLQTKNYLRFLLLQYNLKQDKEKFVEILNAFEQSKATPYENHEFSYEFIRNYLPADNNQIQTSVDMAGQLGAILSTELRGNPRNIKRFLNTIFLRQRVAIIYKIADKVKLDALTKLLLLERFHDKQWELLVNEVTASQDGKSTLVKRLEETKEVTENENANETKKKAGDEFTYELLQWGRLKPSLKEVDLRPYLFVSKEKAVGFTSISDIPLALTPVYEVLVSGASVAMAGKEADIKALNAEQAMLIFQTLTKTSRSISNWDSIPEPVKGMQYLLHRHPFLETEFVKMLDVIPSADVKPWMLSNLGGFTTSEGKQAKKALLDRIIASSDTPRNIITLAKQMQAK